MRNAGKRESLRAAGIKEGAGVYFFSGRFRAGGRQGRGAGVPPMRGGPGRAKSAAQYEYVCSPTEHKK